jgi:hypothetical protein
MGTEHPEYHVRFAQVIRGGEPRSVPLVTLVE